MVLSTQSIPKKAIAREEPKGYEFVVDELGRRSVRKIRKAEKVIVSKDIETVIKPSLKKVKKK